MKLSISRITNTSTNDCDLAVVEVVLQYYDKPYTERSLLDYLHKHSYGSLMTEMADCLLQHGVLSTIVSANPHLFSRKEWDEFSLRENYPQQISEFHSNELQRVMKKGVMLRTEIPSEEIIEEELKAKRPVIISYNKSILDQNIGITFHYGIISDSTKDSFTIIDPSCETEPKQKYPKNVVMFAIHSLASKNPMAGSIILTKERKKKK